MSLEKVMIARIYLSESEAHLHQLMKRLHDWEKLRGVTVFRGITGFGNSGKLHSSAIEALSLDLPIVVEFFDSPEKVMSIVDHLASEFKPGHILTWEAFVRE